MLMLVGTGASGISPKGSEGNEGRWSQSGGRGIVLGVQDWAAWAPQGRLAL